MNKKKYWITQLFFVLFTLSVSTTVLPWGNINVHGIFGEVTSLAIIEDKDQEIENIKPGYNEVVQKIKGVNIINIWFEVLIMVICIRFCANLIRLPRGDTIVTLKARMDD